MNYYSVCYALKFHQLLENTHFLTKLYENIKIYIRNLLHILQGIRASLPAPLYK